MATIKYCKGCKQILELTSDLKCIRGAGTFLQGEVCLVDKLLNDEVKGEVFAINTFDNLSPLEKRAKMQKRAHEHFLKNDLEKKIQMNKDLMDGLKNG
jgi:hypothetical protein